MSETVVLPTEKETIKFAPRCVYCNLPNQGEMYEAKGSPEGYYGYYDYLTGNSGKIEVPAHRPCGLKYHRRQLLQILGSTLIIVAVIILITTAVGSGVALPFEPTKINIVLATLVALSPLLILQMIYSPPFEFSVGNKTIRFEFADPDLAEEFAENNGVKSGMDWEAVKEMAGDVLKIGAKLDNK
ncbi:MAG: hypothetical protein R2747_09765 [Pyrinomonadaceae bacterium]